MPAKSPEENRARARAWYNANKERARARQKDYYRANKEKAVAYAKEWRENNKDRQKNAVLKFNYGITLSEYDAMWEAQGFACASCRSTEPMHKKGWHLDHCHGSGKVRGILCHHCNIAAGHLRDDPARARRLADYLEKHQ